LHKKTSIEEGKLDFIIEKNVFFSVARCAQESLEDIDLDVCLEKVKGKADIFTFRDRVPKKTVNVTFNRYKVLVEQDNIAAIRLTTYDYWWTNQIGKKTRNMVRKAIKMGVQVRILPLSEDLVTAATKIYNETPIRQGRRFIHYGEKFNDIKKLLEVKKYPNDFICAFYRNELIGFIHLCYSKDVAVIRQILSMQKHWNKAPNNITISKAVEMACQKGLKYLVYGELSQSSLSDFKRRNGFQEILLRRYYIPLTFKGRIVLTFNLQRKARRILPNWIKKPLSLIRRFTFTSRCF